MRTFVILVFGATLMLSAVANWTGTASLGTQAAPSVETTGRAS